MGKIDMHISISYYQLFSLLIATGKSTSSHDFVGHLAKDHGEDLLSERIKCTNNLRMELL